MPIYDTHSDIFYNLAFKSIEDPFKAYHLDDLNKGGVVGGIWVVYSDEDFDVVSAYKKAIEKFKNYENDFDVIKGLEGLRNVPDLKTLEVLYNMGIRHASLTWNEENHLATGVRGNSDRGLTNLGKEFIKYMNEHNMIIDVSHLNEKSFYEVLKEQPKILIASHSNAFSLSDHIRNLKDEQLEALRDAGGMIGCVAARNFVSKNKADQNINGLVKQIKYLVNIMGIDRVMLGLDMMNYLSDFQIRT
jgi:membrane dipeptidase